MGSTLAVIGWEAVPVTGSMVGAKRPVLVTGLATDPVNGSMMPVMGWEVVPVTGSIVGAKRLTFGLGAS
jgi:hypothetical protein